MPAIQSAHGFAWNWLYRGELPKGRLRPVTGHTADRGVAEAPNLYNLEKKKTRKRWMTLGDP